MGGISCKSIPPPIPIRYRHTVPQWCCCCWPLLLLPAGTKQRNRQRETASRFVHWIINNNSILSATEGEEEMALWQWTRSTPATTRQHIICPQSRVHTERKRKCWSTHIEAPTNGPYCCWAIYYTGESVEQQQQQRENIINSPVIGASSVWFCQLWSCCRCCCKQASKFWTVPSSKVHWASLLAADDERKRVPQCCCTS